MAGLGRKPGGHGRGQRPGQHRQPGPAPGQYRSAGGGLMVRVPGHPGVVENEHAARADTDGGRRDMAGELAGRDAGQTAVGVVQQRDAGRAEFGGRLAQLVLARPMQVGPRLIRAWMPRRG